MGFLTALIGPVLNGVFGIIDKSVEDKDAAAKLKADIQMQVLTHQKAELEAAANIVLAEANGNDKQRNWRPNAMYVFLGMLIFAVVVVPVAGAFGIVIPFDVAWAAIPENLWTTIQIGLGGYVVGRSGEKMMQTYSQGRPNGSVSQQ